MGGSTRVPVCMQCCSDGQPDYSSTYTTGKTTYDHENYVAPDILLKFILSGKWDVGRLCISGIHFVFQSNSKTEAIVIQYRHTKHIQQPSDRAMQFYRIRYIRNDAIITTVFTCETVLYLSFQLGGESLSP